MTVDCPNIESIFRPLRNNKKFDAHARPALWGGEPLDCLKWTDTSEPPVSEWIGYVDESISHEDLRERMRPAAFLAFLNRVPVLADGYKWCLLNHQAGGVACRQIQFVGMHIELRPAIESRWLEIVKFWYHSELGHGIPTLTELNQYRSQLQEMGLDCNNSDSFIHLMEGLYPVDLDQIVFDSLCQNPFPLKNLLGTQPWGCISDPAILVVIAPNSD